MSNLNTEEIKKLKKGELWGQIALICAGVVLAAICALCILYVVREDDNFRIYALCLCLPVGIFALIAAICNLKYGRALDRIIKTCVQEVLIENAALMHPEKDSITYYISNDGWQFFVKANNFKELITFDFSAFGKLSTVRKAAISTAIIERLGATFCRLMERGGKYKTVSYCVIKDGKQGKTVNIIENGTPDKKIYKNYLKQQ